MPRAVAFHILAFTLATAADLRASAPSDSLPTLTERRQALRAEIALHDEQYFRRADPLIPDEAYDALRRELTEIEQALGSAPPVATEPPESDDRDPVARRALHRAPMLSLTKSHTPESVREFVERIVERFSPAEVRFTVEPKLDGVALSLTYQHGRFVRALTRGNGVEGQDVSDAASQLIGFCETLTLPFPDLIELRGEVCVSYRTFAQLNAARAAAGERPHLHPRNLAAGTLQQTDLALVRERELTLVLHGVGAVQPDSARDATLRDFYAACARWGFRHAGTGETVPAASVWDTVAAQHQANSHGDFPTDGVVIKVASAAQQQVLGSTASAPRWALAHKVAGARARTTVRGIVWQVGRTGELTAVAELTPVLLDGSVIERATLYGPRQVELMDIRPLDTAEVVRAGGVIPAVVKVLKSERGLDASRAVVPNACPSCDHALHRETEQLYCRNRSCGGRLVRAIVWFTGSSGVRIRGFGPSLAEQLVTHGRVRELNDVYRLSVDDLTPFVGAGAEDLVAGITTSRHSDLATVLSALGLDQVGPARARRVAEHFRSVTRLIEASVDQLERCGFSPLSATRFHAEINEPGTRRVLLQFVGEGEAGQPDDSLQGVQPTVRAPDEDESIRHDR